MYSNKKIFYVSTLLVLILVAGVAFLFNGMNSEPVIIHSQGMWPPTMLNNSYLANQSTIIIKGTVEEIQPSRWTTADGNKPLIVGDERIYTDVVINVDEYLKNPQPANKITVRTLGGRVKDVTMSVEDEAEFEPDEKVILFLTSEDPFTANIGGEHFRVTGWVHGKFTLVDDKAVRPKLPPEHQNIPFKELLANINESK